MSSNLTEIAVRISEELAQPLIVSSLHGERFVSESLNRKMSGIFEAGIVAGFEPELAGGMIVRVTSKSAKNGLGAALVDNSELTAVTVRQLSDVQVVIPATGVSIVVVEAIYGNIRTRQVDANSNTDAAVVKVVSEKTDTQVELFRVNAPAGTEELTLDMLDLTHRQFSSASPRIAESLEDDPNKLISLELLNSLIATGELGGGSGSFYVPEIIPVTADSSTLTYQLNYPVGFLVVNAEFQRPGAAYDFTVDEKTKTITFLSGKIEAGDTVSIYHEVVKSNPNARATQSIIWPYNGGLPVSSGLTDLYLPFKAASVSMLNVSGNMQYVGLHFDYFPEEQRINLKGDTTDGGETIIIHTEFKAIDALMPEAIRGYDFSKGGRVSSINDHVYNPADGSWYLWTGEYPHSFDAGESPGAGWAFAGGDSKLRENLLSESVTKHVRGMKRVFNIEDYGAVPDYNLATKEIVTDSFAAIQRAKAAALLVNGTVYIPGCPIGYAFYSSARVRLEASYFNGVKMWGDGIQSSFLVTGDLVAGVSAFTSSGNPVASTVGDFTVYSHENLKNPEKYIGVGVILQNTTFAEHGEMRIEGFEEGARLYNEGSTAAVSFTEFNDLNKWWLKNNKAQLRLAKGTKGNASFHGNAFEKVVMNVGKNQKGLVIDEGVVLYNSTCSLWIFGTDNTSILIENAGSWSGMANLFFEGKGTLRNTGSFIIQTGAWRVQNDTGLLNDESTVPICHVGYRTPTQLAADFQAFGMKEIGATGINTISIFYRDLFRIRGQNIEAIGYCAYEGGDYNSQGFAMCSQAYGDTAEKIKLRSLWHIQGITSNVSKFSLNYKKGGDDQLAINSSGRATGKFGRRSVGTISASDSAQTIILTGMIPVQHQGCEITIYATSADGTNVLYGTFTGSSIKGVNRKCTASDEVFVSGSAISFGAANGVNIFDGGSLRISMTARVDLTYTVTVMGNGDV